MNQKSTFTLAALLLFAGADRAAAQGTAFTYQGQLMDAGAPANGLYDIRGGLYATNTGGTPVSALYTNTAVAVSNGLFAITLDFGGLLNGTSYWLQIDVRTNGAGAAFTPLSGRPELTPTPYAIFAEGANAAGLTGTVPMASLSGAYGAALDLTNAGNSFAGNGAGLTNVNAAELGGVSSGTFWQLGGNNAGSGAFLGTTNNQVMDLRVNNVRAARFWLVTDPGGFYTNAPNVILGAPVNTISGAIIGGTISGGGASDVSGNIYSNNVTANFGTVAGGYGNLASGFASTAGGGQQNASTFTGATVAGGSGNTASSGYSTVGGGSGNAASGYQATVGGGSGNVASGDYSTAPGGSGNTAGGIYSFAAGQYARTTNAGTFIWSDGSQNPFTGASFDNGFNVLASGGVFFFNGSEGLHIDYLNQNAGAIAYGLRFGAGSSGEGVASKRTSGGNQYGLDFYTSGNNQMSIANNGFVGINTTSPSQRLEVNGNFVQIDGANAADGNGPIDAYIGGNGSGSDVQVGSMNSLITSVAFYNWGNNAWMHIACSSITINGGSDLAEPFEISSAGSEIPQGSVVVIDDQTPGHLKISEEAYDTRVAGVISGANGVNPGIQMRQQGAIEGGKNVALSGRVYVLADAANGAIRPGDLLTTSGTPGHAMKVTDHAKAQGAILGKAMTALDEGQGMVLVLVTLQ